MYTIIIGSIAALASIPMMRASNNSMVFLGMLSLILGLYMIKRGREKSGQRK